MSFVLSKIVGTLLAPGTLLLLLVSAAFLTQRWRPRMSRLLTGLALLALVALAVTPAPHWIAGPLENRFPAPAILPGHIDGIIVLGGAIDVVDSKITGQPEMNDSAERLTAFVALSRRYPEAKLVYTGGSGLLRNQEVRETDVARTLFASLGLDISRIVFERESRNTWENALFSQRMLSPRPNETWLLVTSAWHMPRAVGCFRGVGWNVIPYPVDHIGANTTAWLSLDIEGQLHRVSLATREWIGLISYRLMGRTSAMFPAP